MTTLLAWIYDQWFPILQGAGIVGSLIYGGIALQRDIRSRQISDLLKLTDQHRQLWREVHRRPELARVLQTDVDLVAHPITTAEEEFLNMVIVHFSTGWEVARRGGLVSPEALVMDARDFFQRPMPKAVWQKTKPYRSPPFVEFVEGSRKTASRIGATSRETAL